MLTVEIKGLEKKCGISSKLTINSLERHVVFFDDSGHT